MRSLVLFALCSLAAAKPKPGGLIDPWQSSGVGLSQYSSVGLVHQPTVAVAQPVVHAAPVIAQPVVHAAPAVIAKPATSYSSFQQIIHPVSVAQPVVHAAPVVQTIAQPVVHSAPVVQAAPVVHAAPVVQTVSQPIVQKVVSVGSYGGYGGYGSYGGYGHGW